MINHGSSKRHEHIKAYGVWKKRELKRLYSGRVGARAVCENDTGEPKFSELFLIPIRFTYSARRNQILTLVRNSH